MKLNNLTQHELYSSEIKKQKQNGGTNIDCPWNSYFQKKITKQCCHRSLSKCCHRSLNTGSRSEHQIVVYHSTNDVILCHQGDSSSKGTGDIAAIKNLALQLNYNLALWIWRLGPAHKYQNGDIYF